VLDMRRAHVAADEAQIDDGPRPHGRHGATAAGPRQPITSRPRVGPRSTQKTAPTPSVARIMSHGSSCSHAQRSIPTSRRLPPFPPRSAGPVDSASPCCEAAATHETRTEWQANGADRRNPAKERNARCPPSDGRSGGSSSRSKAGVTSGSDQDRPNDCVSIVGERMLETACAASLDTATTVRCNAWWGPRGSEAAMTTRRAVWRAGLLALLFAAGEAMTPFARRSVARARVDTARELASVVLPHGARKVRRDRSANRVLGSQGTDCLKKYVVDDHGFWRVARRPAEVRAWMRKHWHESLLPVREVRWFRAVSRAVPDARRVGCA
jgi:hypothetical protein